MSRRSKAEEFADTEYAFHITGRNVQVTDAMKAYAIDKITKIERFSNRITDIQITMDIVRFLNRVDIVLRLDHVTIKVHAESDDMYVSIDKAVEKMESQVCRYRERIKNHHAMGLQDIDVNSNMPLPQEDELNSVNDQIEEATGESLDRQYNLPQIVKRERLPVKLLSHSEAIKKMEISGDLCLIFRNEEDNKIKVLYRNANGKDYNIIEPQI